MLGREVAARSAGAGGPLSERAATATDLTELVTGVGQMTKFMNIIYFQ
jgi:hypothetical protein